MSLISAYMCKFLVPLLLFPGFFSLLTPTPAWAQSPAGFSSPYGFNLGGHFNKDKVARRRIPPEEFANVAQLISQSGAKWVRVMVFWRNLQPQKASDWRSYEWSYLTQLMTSLREQGLLIDLVITEVPRWANGAPSEEEAGGYPPIRMEDWEQFIIKLVQKIGAAGIKIGAWEIENEVDGNGKTGYRERPEKYVEMFTRAVPLIRSVSGIHERGQAFIMPSSFFNVHFAKDDISYWLTHLNKDYIDALSFHTYGPDETQLLRYWNNFLTLRNDAGLRSKPVWLTETNLNEEPKGYLDPAAAVKMPQRIQTFINGGAQKVFWYCEADGYWGAGVLKIEDFSTRPRFVKHEDVYQAYQSLTGVLEPPPPTEECSLVSSQEKGEVKAGLTSAWKSFAAFKPSSGGRVLKVAIKAGNYGGIPRGLVCKITDAGGTADLSAEASSPAFKIDSGAGWREVDFSSQSFRLEKDTEYRLYCKGPDTWGSLYWVWDVLQGKTYRLYISLTGVPEPPPSESLVGDLNSDGVVNETDRDIFRTWYLTSESSADFDHSGLVEANDYLILVSNFGRRRQ